MTAQIAERLLYEGEELAMCTNPLADYFALGGSRPSFESNSTALWRGYVGRWEVVDGRLYLIDLRGTLDDGTEASLSSVFPEFPERVFAHWYSGTIRVPQGKLLKYLHMGYGSTYERDFLLEVERGVVTGRRLRQNGTAPSDDRAEGYAPGAMLVFPRTKRLDSDQS